MKHDSTDNDEIFKSNPFHYLTQRELMTWNQWLKINTKSTSQTHYSKWKYHPNPMSELQIVT